MMRLIGIFNLTNKKLQAVWSLASQFVEIKQSHNSQETPEIQQDLRPHEPPDTGQRPQLRQAPFIAQAGFMADLTSLGELPSIVQHPVNDFSQQGQAMSRVLLPRRPEQPCKERVLRAESLASGTFRRDKFWPRRYRCERGILEVLDDINFEDANDFPEAKSISSEQDEYSDECSRWIALVGQQEADAHELNAN